MQSKFGVIARNVVTWQSGCLCAGAFEAFRLPRFVPNGKEKVGSLAGFS